jgi:hypothetical protein
MNIYFSWSFSPLVFFFRTHLRYLDIICHHWLCRRTRPGRQILQNRFGKGKNEHDEEKLHRIRPLRPWTWSVRPQWHDEHCSRSLLDGWRHSAPLWHLGVHSFVPVLPNPQHGIRHCIPRKLSSFPFLARCGRILHDGSSLGRQHANFEQVWLVRVLDIPRSLFCYGGNLNDEIDRAGAVKGTKEQSS